MAQRSGALFQQPHTPARPTAAIAFSILVHTETTMSSGFFLKKKATLYDLQMATCE
jgi:hypothetical protein